MIRRAAGTTSTTVGAPRRTTLTAGTTDGIAVDRAGHTTGTTVAGLARRRPATVTTGTGSCVDTERRRRITTPPAVTTPPGAETTDTTSTARDPTGSTRGLGAGSSAVGAVATVSTGAAADDNPSGATG